MKNRKDALAIVLFLLTISGCVGIEAERYDETNECWHEPEVVDCALGSGGSLGSASYAKGPGGDLWYFDSEPLPDGFTDIDPENEYGELKDRRCSDL